MLNQLQTSNGSVGIGITVKAKRVFQEINCRLESRLIDYVTMIIMR